MTSNLPQLLLFVLLFGIIVFVVVAYFAGTGLKGDKKQLHQRIWYRWWEALKTRYLHPLYEKLKKILAHTGGPIYDSVRQVKQALREHITGRDYLYRVPWYAVVGDALSHKEQLLESLDLAHPIDSPKFGIPQKDPHLSWWFFDKGIVVDVAEKSLYAKQKGGAKVDWNSFLKALARYRPSRPLDGLILTVPAQYFYGKTKLTQAELEKRAEALSSQLVQTEKFLGFKLPVYFMITGLESVPGFKGYCQEIPLEAQQEMFGWSNDQSVEAPYKSHWVKAAFKKMAGFLFENTLTIFSKGKVEEYGDDMMVFLKEFAALEEGVTHYLDALFRVNDYRDYFILRGIYGTGVGKTPEVALAGLDAQTESIVSLPSNKSSWFFLKDLFQKKIFVERGVAFPVKRFLKSTNRVITYLKAGIITTAAVGSVSLYLGYGHLTRATGEIQPALAQVLHDLHVQGDRQLSDKAFASHAFERQARTILDLVVKTANWPLASPLLLPSMMSALDDRLYDDIFDIYNLMIARPMYMALANRAENMMRNELPTPVKANKANKEQLYNPTKTTEFMTLAGYVDELAMLEDRVSIYNNLRKSGNAAALEKMIHYLYGFQFPESFLEDDSPLKEKLIGDAQYRPFNLDNYRLYAEKRLYQLYNGFLERILDPAYVYRLVAQLQERLEHVDAGGTPDIESLYKTLLQIKEVVTFASIDGAGWLIKPEFDLGARYKTMMEKITRLNIFTDAVQKKIMKVSHALHEKAVHYLKSYGSPLTGYFFATSPATKRLEPSQGLLTLEKGLGLFLHKPFMSKTDGSKFKRDVPNNQLLHWDRRIIANAIALIDNYEDFLEDELPGYPADLQDTLRVVGLQQLERNIEAMLERSQTFFETPAHAWGKQAEDAARLQVDNVQYAGPLLLKLLNKLDGISSKMTYMDLRNLIFSQMYQNLKQLDKVLQEGGYFLPLSKDFSWWRGEKGVLLKAYAMNDKHEMKTYFENQTQHVMHMITEYGSPVMQVLKADAFSMNNEEVVTFARWNRLMEEAVAYQQKKAVGSLKALETFLVDLGNEVTDKDCLEKITVEDSRAKSGDYFLQKRNDIRRIVFKQCQMINTTRAAAQYNKLAEYFNSFMANTFPFMNGVPDGSKIAADVSDKIIQEFFSEFDKLTPQMRRAIKEVGVYGSSWKKSSKFLSQMSKVRVFMDKYFAPKTKEGDPGVDFRVEFRQNQMREKHGDKVLDWAVVVGDKTTSMKEGNKVVRWDFGKNVAFGFQWALDAPLKPVENDSIQALIHVGGRSMYVYQGYWALIRAMLLHRTPPQEGGSTRNDTLMKFEVPVGQNPAMAPVDTAKLFMRIIPQTSKGLSDLAFKIPAFPTEAPRLLKEFRSRE